MPPPFYARLPLVGTATPRHSNEPFSRPRPTTWRRRWTWTLSIFPQLTSTTWLRRLDARTVNVRGTDHEISTAGATVERVDADPVQRFLKWLANPHLVFIMLAAGGILILIETISPGGWVAGITGAGLLVLAFLGMGSLPVNWVGLVLIGVGLVLFFWELQAPGWGGFGLAGGVSFLVGGFLLFGDSSIPGLPAPDVRVGYGVLGGTALFMAASLVGLWYFSRKAKAPAEPAERRPNSRAIRRRQDGART